MATTITDRFSGSASSTSTDRFSGVPFSAATPNIGYQLRVQHANYALSGNPVFPGPVFGVSGASYAFAGQSVGLGAGAQFGTAAYALSGQSVAFSRGLLVSVSSYAMTAKTAGFALSVPVTAQTFAFSGQTVSFRTATLTLVDKASGTAIGDMTGNGGLAACFDGTTSQNTVASAIKSSTSNPAYVGKTFSANKVFGKALIYGSNDQGFKGLSSPSVTINIRGKTGAAPSTWSDGTVIRTVTFTDTNDESATARLLL